MEIILRIRISGTWKRKMEDEGECGGRYRTATSKSQGEAGGRRDSDSEKPEIGGGGELEGGEIN